MDENIPRSLSARWRSRSIRAGWSAPGDWWTPAVEQTSHAVLRGHDVARACFSLGDARARAGVGVAEGLADLAALYAVLGRGEPPFEALRAFAVGWAEATFAPIAELRCEDPLTGLATPAYLRTRVAELYRGRTAARHRLVVVESSVPAEGLAERLAVALAMASLLRGVFAGGETLALLSSARLCALTRADHALTRGVAALRAGRVTGGRGLHARTLSLPGQYEEALALLRSLR